MKLRENVRESYSKIGKEFPERERQIWEDGSDLKESKNRVFKVFERQWRLHDIFTLPQTISFTFFSLPL